MTSFKQIRPNDKIIDPPTSPRSIVAMNRCGITAPDIIYVSREELRHRIAYKNLTDNEFHIYYTNYEAMRKEALSQAIAEYNLILEQGISQSEAALYPHLRFPNVTAVPSTPRAELTQTSMHNPDDLKVKIIERHVKEVELNLRQRIMQEAQQQIQLEVAREYHQKAQEIENRVTAKYEDEAVKYILQEQHRLEILRDFQDQQNECRKRSYEKTLQEMAAHDALLQRRQQYLDDQSVRSKTRSIPREEFLYQLAQERKAEDRARELEFKERQLIREQRSQRAQEKRRQGVEKLQKSLHESQIRHTHAFNKYWDDVARSKSADFSIRENRRLAGAKRALIEKEKENNARISETNQRIEDTLRNFSKIYRNKQDAKARKLEEEDLRSTRHIMETSVNVRQRALEDELLKDLRTKRAEMHLRRVQYEKENVLSNKEFKAINSIRALNMTKEKEEELVTLSNKLHTQRHILKGSQTIRDDGYLDIPEDLRKMAPPDSILRCHYMNEAIDMLKGEESFKRTLRMVPIIESYASVYKSSDYEPRKKRGAKNRHNLHNNSMSEMSMDTPDSGRQRYYGMNSHGLRSSNANGLLVERRAASLNRPRTASRNRIEPLSSTRLDSSAESSMRGYYSGSQGMPQSLKPRNASRPKKSGRNASSKQKTLSHAEDDGFSAPSSKKQIIQNSLRSTSDSMLSTPQQIDSTIKRVDSTKKKSNRPKADDTDTAGVKSIPALKGPGAGMFEEEKRRNANAQDIKKSKPKAAKQRDVIKEQESQQHEALKYQSQEIVRQLSQLAKANKSAISQYPPPNERRELLDKLRGSGHSDNDTTERTRQIYASLSVKANEAGIEPAQFEHEELQERTQTRHLFASLGKSGSPNDHMDTDLILTAFSKATPEATQINEDTPRYFMPGSITLLQESAPQSQEADTTKNYVTSHEYHESEATTTLRPVETSTYSIALPSVSADHNPARFVPAPQSPQHIINPGADITASDLKISSLEDVLDTGNLQLTTIDIPAQDEQLPASNTRESIGYFVASSTKDPDDNTDDEN